MRWHGWAPYVPVAARRARALKKMEKLRKKGLDVKPVEIEGRKIARTFWGEAWCNHLESFSDYENRLPRGRTYVRNGSVCHLDIAEGEINAVVSGSALYTVRVAVNTLPPKKWKEVKNCCAGQIGSLLELLQGRLSGNVMSIVTDRDRGLFPLPGEISLRCSCPDWAVMCKHVAAVLYGVGARLDQTPELLFLLRGVDHEELISAKVDFTVAASEAKGGRRRIAEDALADVFGIEMSEEAAPEKTGPSKGLKKAAPDPKIKTSKLAEKRPTKRKTRVEAKTAPVQKKTAGATRALKAPSKEHPVTGKDVAALRAKFDMSQSEFARLLGVSAPSVWNWERKPGPLDLQARSLAAWNAARKLTKTRAQKKLQALKSQP